MGGGNSKGGLRRLRYSPRTCTSKTLCTVVGADLSDLLLTCLRSDQYSGWAFERLHSLKSVAPGWCPRSTRDPRGVLRLSQSSRFPLLSPGDACCSIRLPAAPSESRVCQAGCKTHAGPASVSSVLTNLRAPQRNLQQSDQPKSLARKTSATLYSILIHIIPAARNSI